MLILVRHAMPAFGPDVPAHEWELSEDGRTAAAVLARLLPAGARLVGSNEPKAWQTLEPAGSVDDRDARFNEVFRVGEPWEGEFRELRHAYVTGFDHDGWEPRADVARRFDAGVTEQLAVAGEVPLVVASHGMAMTVWLTARIGLADPGEFWAGLCFPDAHQVDLRAGTIRRLAGTGAAG
ncbi:MAG: histidine phosphatase family protein [Actinomycetes bacterium]